MPAPTANLPAPPPACPAPGLIGRDGEGRWVALVGRSGGLFRTREAAMRYVCAETGCRPADVALSAVEVRLRLS